MNDQTKSVAFLGLGVMGSPMAGHLARAGHRVTVYNRSADKAQAWVEKHGGRSAATPADAARGADIVFACVGADADVREVTLGPSGCFQAMGRGTVFADHTTASAEIARELDAAAWELGIFSLDAPVSGGQAGAENGQLTIMVGGPEDGFAVAEPVMRCYGKAVTLMGPAGSGQLTKMVNQVCVAGIVQALSEGLHFTQRAGLDGNRVLDVIGKGAAQSWQMDNRGSTMLEGRFDFGFAVDWMRKDLGLVLSEAKRNGASLPVTALVDQFYADVQKLGGSRWDTSSLIARLK
ncbi:MAG TPA: NAD(P)-dependent oxidoreductase [Arenibaculum sp.]|nr:NAD(P)-dependent oxidoreductase [Arenibaculum sp.]